MLRFIAILVFVVTCSDAQKSCESLVRYGTESAGGEGFLSIPAPKISNHELKVKFTIDSRLRSNYAGDIGLTNSAEEAVDDIRHKTPLSYRVKFPPGSQSPKIVSVYYNNRELCDDKADNFQTLVTLTHQLDTGVRLETETDNEDTFRTITELPRKVQPTLPTQIPRIVTPPQEIIVKPKTPLSPSNNAEKKGFDLLQKIAAGQFKPIAVINPSEGEGKQYGIQEINNGIKRYTAGRKDVDLTLKIPGSYIENAVVAIVISVADPLGDGTGQIVYQNILNKN